MDKIEAHKNLKLLKQNRKRLEEYNHLFSSHAFKQECLIALRKVNEQIGNIEVKLNGRYRQQG
ncbi:hypothetical protein [Acinetobacter sp. CFCC 10889]|uniref:hypothetical protein n=1 Tax=Acinetobacter sp. CFCC 10889 TaxID=1775557 RepID=UPI000DCF6EF8|nr:hypothetical protein [Acinetobacter sp. CFCC 10889]